MATPAEFSIAILDDNSFYCMFLGARLRQFANHISGGGRVKIRIVQFTSPVDFLLNVPENTEVAIIDYFLNNEYNGIKVMEELQEKHPQCKAIIISAHSSVNTSLVSILKGAHTFIPKDQNTLMGICNAVEKIIAQREG